MTTPSIRTAAMALAAAGLTLSAPASAMPQVHAGVITEAYGPATQQHGGDWDRHDRGRHKGWHKRHHDRRDDYRDYRQYRPAYYGSGYRQAYYGEPVYANTRVWQNNGQTYCRKSNGTTGLIIGGAAGALLGRELAGYRGDRTLGAILGAAGGALLGKSLDSGMRCR